MMAYCTLRDISDNSSAVSCTENTFHASLCVADFGTCARFHLHLQQMGAALLKF